MSVVGLLFYNIGNTVILSYRHNLVSFVAMSGVHVAEMCSGYHADVPIWKVS